jgi:hypothetical protein
MHDAVYNCLVSRGEACYSIFLSYRVASEAPLARLLFDELNHRFPALLSSALQDAFAACSTVLNTNTLPQRYRVDADTLPRPQCHIARAPSRCLLGFVAGR